jgi:nucleoside-diphosphate-sugar epimerase
MGWQICHSNPQIKGYLMRILVTGATGFVGYHVIHALLAKGNVDIIATAIDGDTAKIKDWYDRVTFIPFSIDEKTIEATDNLFAFFKCPDAIIHLTWEGLPNYMQLFHFERVLPRQFMFLKKLIEQGLQNVNVMGTCLEYGLREGKLSEAMYPKPNTAYGLAKDTLRRQLEILRGQLDFDLKWIRLFYLYGVGQNPNSLISQLDRAIERGDETFNMSGGEQQRDYLSIERAAGYIANITIQNKITGIINCCSGKPTTVNELVEKRIQERKATIILNRGVYPYLDFEPFAFWGDNTKLKAIV